MNPSRRTTAGLVCSLLLVAYIYALAKPAVGVEAATVTIREAALSENGHARLIVSVAGAGDAVLGRDAFAVTEAGDAVPSLTVTPLLEAHAQPVTVALVFDVSGSTAGGPLVDAKAAGKRFVSLLPAGVRVMVVSFGPRASVRQGLTADHGALARAIGGLTASGGTAMYDGIVLAATRLAGVAAQHNIVLFSDGKDTSSVRTLSQSVAAAKRASAPVTSVGLVTPDFDATALARIADATGGRSLRVGQSAQLGAAFGQVAKDIASQYVLEFESGAARTKEIELAVTLRAGALSVSDSVVVLNPRTGLPPPLPAISAPDAEAAPPIRAFAGRTGLYVGVGSVFLALILLLGVLMPRPGARGGDRLLRSMRAKTKSRNRGASDDERHGLAGSAIARTAVHLVERAPKRSGFEERLQMRLDRAGWPLRASEFVVLQGAGVAAGALVGVGLLQRWWLGIVLAVIGGMVF
ncbi:MAG: VWA domain-containing protein, partial [Actinomycetota bacterium]